jgi:hypothetical protein
MEIFDVAHFGTSLTTGFASGDWKLHVLNTL